MKSEFFDTVAVGTVYASGTAMLIKTLNLVLLPVGTLQGFIVENFGISSEILPVVSITTFALVVFEVRKRTHFSLEEELHEVRTLVHFVEAGNAEFFFFMHKATVVAILAETALFVGGAKLSFICSSVVVHFSQVVSEFAVGFLGTL